MVLIEQEGNTSLILAIEEWPAAATPEQFLAIEGKKEPTAEALVAATASAGALDVQVDGRGREEG